MSPTPKGGAGRTLWPLYAARLYRQGAQLVFPLYTQIVRALEAVPGDLVLVRVHLPFVTFRVCRPDMSVPLHFLDEGVVPPTYRELLAEIAKAMT